jgi:hypothetical protein
MMGNWHELGCRVLQSALSRLPRHVSVFASVDVAVVVVAVAVVVDVLVEVVVFG